MTREELKAQIDELMRQYADEEIDGATYQQKMMELTTSAQKEINEEWDSVIYNENEKYAIELKYPLNGQYPEQMYSFVKDIKFMEQLKEAGFDGAYCVTLVQDKNFYSGNKVDGVYSYFRNGNTIHGTIIKPTGKKDESIDVHGEYQVEWKSINNWKYYIVDMWCALRKEAGFYRNNWIEKRYQ